MLQVLPTGNIAVLDSYYNLFMIIPPTEELSTLLRLVPHRPPTDLDRISTKPDRLNINVEDLDI